MRFSLRTCLEIIFVIAAFLALWKAYYPTAAIRRGELLEVRADGTLIDQPIYGLYKVDDVGNVDLGPSYGTARIEGLTIDEARAAILSQLQKVLVAPEVSVMRVGSDAILAIQAENRRLEQSLRSLAK